MKVFDAYNHGKWIADFEASSFEGADIVVMPGGSDIQPKYYHNVPIKGCYYNTRADEEGYELLQKAIKANKFIVGICKGAQWLTIAAGGWLIQDIDNHQSPHMIETFDGDTLMVNSLHHQMCYPYDLPDEDYQLLAWSEESHRYLVQGEQDLADVVEMPEHICTSLGRFKEPEVIFYPKIRGLAIQSHPEGYSPPAETNAWFNELITTLM